MVALEIAISLLLFALFVIGAIRGLRFFFVCVSVPFSSKSASQFCGHSIKHIIWSVIGIFSLMFILLAFGIEPPGFYKLVLHFQRPHQRHIIFERAQSVGGWGTIQKESEDLLDKHRGDYFRWDKWHTNMPPLTPALVGLKPQTVWVDERSNLPSILRIDVFGMWHTGSDPTTVLWDLGHTRFTSCDIKSSSFGCKPIWNTRSKPRSLHNESGLRNLLNLEMQLRFLRLFLIFSAIGWCVCIVGVFATWPQVNSIAQGMGAKPIAHDPMLDYWLRMICGRVHVGRHLVFSDGTVAAKIRRGDSVLWLADGCGGRHPAHFRLAVRHRAISILR